MRQVIVSHIMSVDGYYEGPGRNVIAPHFWQPNHVDRSGCGGSR
jgi:hypothetical protein